MRHEAREMHAVYETAHAKTDGHVCRLTDGIQRKRVNTVNLPIPYTIYDRGCIRCCWILHNGKFHCKPL